MKWEDLGIKIALGLTSILAYIIFFKSAMYPGFYFVGHKV